LTGKLDVLIPTYNRPAALAVTLTSLAMQIWPDFRVLISDQSEGMDAIQAGEVRAAMNVLRAHGNVVEMLKHLPRRGLAEQRQFLLEQVTAPYALFLDDDLILEPFVLGNMLEAIEEEACGFVGSAVIGLSLLAEVRPDEQQIEFWEGPVTPEEVHPGAPAWERYRLHNAANLFHVQERLGLTAQRPRKYRVAWVGGCVLYDAAKLRSVGGFGFWRALPPEHAGEDVLAQLRVMARYGGCGLIPSGVYHQELPTTVKDRRVDAPKTSLIAPLKREGAVIYQSTGAINAPPSLG
jgi:GT2 family glycosyltransferase